MCSAETRSPDRLEQRYRLKGRGAGRRQLVAKRYQLRPPNPAPRKPRRLAPAVARLPKLEEDATRVGAATTPPPPATAQEVGEAEGYRPRPLPPRADSAGPQRRQPPRPTVRVTGGELESACRRSTGADGGLAKVAGSPRAGAHSAAAPAARRSRGAAGHGESGVAARWGGDSVGSSRPSEAIRPSKSRPGDNGSHRERAGRRADRATRQGSAPGRGGRSAEPAARRADVAGTAPAKQTSGTKRLRQRTGGTSTGAGRTRVGCGCGGPGVQATAGGWWALRPRTVGYGARASR
jgi:hypothetical protein